MKIHPLILTFNSMKYLLILLIPISFISPVPDGPVANAVSDEEEITSVIHDFFDAMRTKDTDTIRSHFYSSKTGMQIVGHTDSGVMLQNSDASRFIEGLNQSRKSGVIWDERIDNLDIFIDGRFATAIMDYGFFRDDEFSHCGSNVFSFIKANRWKVFSIIYSRRTEGCEMWQ